MTRGHRARIERDDDRSELLPFVTPPRTRILEVSSEVPPSAHVPSRVGLSAVMHKLSCPSCGEEGRFVLNGTHGTRRSVKCKAAKPGGRVCGRSWAGIALAKAVEAAWMVLKADMAAEQQALPERDEGSEGLVTDCLGNEKVVHTRSPLSTREAHVLDWTDGALADQVVALNQNLCRSQELLARSQKMQEELIGLLLRKENGRISSLSPSVLRRKSYCHEPALLSWPVALLLWRPALRLLTLSLNSKGATLDKKNPPQTRCGPSCGV
jgi:hypothetical protein